MSIDISRVLLSEYSLPMAYITFALTLILAAKRQPGTTTRLLFSSDFNYFILPSIIISECESFFKINYWMAAISCSVDASGYCKRKALDCFLDISVS